jgi:DNA-binding MarR family transcriptional regulator
MVNLIDHDHPACNDCGPMADLIRQLLEARRALASELDSDLADRGFPDVRPGHAAVFLGVDRRSGSRLTDLAEHVRLTKQGMMAMVDDLEARGYVRRVPDPNDARAKLVRLTARGRRAAAECRRAVQSVEQRTRRQLGDRRYDTLRETLEELAESELEAEA